MNPPNPRLQVLVLDVAPALGLAAALVVTSPLAADNAERAIDGPWAYVLLAATGLALGARRYSPRVTSAAMLGLPLVYFALGNPGGPVFAAAFIGLAILIAAESRRVWAPASVASGAALVAAQVPEHGLSAGRLAAFGVWLAGAAIVGAAVAMRRSQLGEAEARAAWAERSRDEEARRRVAEERLRIAREVHDTVGHGLATISLQAGAAERALTQRPAEARASLSAIRTLSNQALEELRAVLGMLRQAEGAGPDGPSPALADLPALVESMRSAGLPVELESDLSGAAVPDVVGAAGYRIVQEALTNVLRHAGPGARARVVARASDRALRVEVSDDGRGVDGDLPSGNGMAGMRERAAAVGGRLEAGRGRGGGFRVAAQLPAGTRWSGS